VVDNPGSGNWTLRIKTLDVPPGGEEVAVNISGLIETPPAVEISGLEDRSVFKNACRHPGLTPMTPTA
jgi:hypothetical protein